ncbi:MAG: twin-arginine translocase TatA/TatE family subunit [Gemmatimonadota bacterium]|nr:twin-arginine translocase TatA/TatE family subunit [Gemmatimonadota bacterium]
MLGNLGYPEIIIICFLALLLFGAKRLPEIGSSLGKSIRSFKSSLKDLQDELPSKDELYKDEPNSKPKANAGTYSESSSPTRDED